MWYIILRVQRVLEVTYSINEEEERKVGRERQMKGQSKGARELITRMTRINNFLRSQILFVINSSVDFSFIYSQSSIFQIC